ncbi:MAG TPA: SpvB/TcaC N-terminal domain-containing protein, partial [Micromonosporaceae bacterium]|nr:SpvB/TcaC N-terminal domain-containing protein [Micromonosporaceae bacterium]
MISLPKGGGAVAGLGEKFTANPFTGTADYSVPIVMPAGRLGVQPQLALAYSTGNGVGPFGLGWALSLPGVARKTSRGVPRYIDAAGPDAPRPDVFVLSGAEDLVQVAGSYPGRVRYRPRTEGLFARVEHVRDSSGDFWQVGAKNGTTQGYGTPRPVNAPAGWRDPAVVADPRDPTRVFGWRITQTSDPMGNLIRYEYLRDHGDEPGRVWDQPLIARIRYADYGDPAAGSFLVDVEFEYEARPDPHSDYRAGFEVRTSLRCKTIRVVTRAADGVARTLREYRLGYQQAGFSGTSLLTRIDVVGIDEQAVAPPPEPGPDPDPVPLPEPDPDPLPQPDSDPQPLPQPDPELALSAPLPDPDPLPQPDPDPVPPAEEHLPPLTFAYTGFSPEGRRFEPVTGAGLPTASLRDPTLALVDLRGIGLPDVVELGAVQRFWRNAGAGRFELPRPLALAPPYSLGDPGVAFLDADGDGRPDLVVSQAGGPAGYFPMTFATGWSARSFQPYRQAPAVSLTDPGVKLVDLDGDGLTDILRSGTRLECWFNDPDPRKAWQRNTFATGLSPDLDLADPRVRLADMTGDGLADLVLLHSGNVAYWPNLGHGRWGAMVAMRRSPRLPDGYDPGRVLLGDVDGDGRADLLYVDTGRVLLWGNQSGNGWTETPVTISGTPEV